MEKKGFTLIEIMAVIVVLGLLIAIIVPVVSNLLKDSEDTLSDEQISMIVNASKKYMIEHSELLPEMSDGSKTFVYIDDLINSGVIDNDKVIDPKTKEELNGCVVVNYNDSFNQYEYNYSDSENDCLITVTFDPEGGSVEESSKQVRYNSTYGELPTPTREGYTFKGWRGKNMLKLSGRSERNPGGGWDNTSIRNNFSGNGIYKGIAANNYYINTNIENNYIIDEEKNNVTVTSKNDGYGIGFDLKVLPNIQYTVSIGSESDASIGIGQYQGDGTYIRTGSGTFTSAQDTFWIMAVIKSNKNTEQTAYNIQIEKGDTATEFEPYQEYSSDTVVTKTSNHTLHAVWEPNSYTVTFDPEGGSVGTTSKQVTFNSTYGELPTPTREGYRFLGWSGKNMYSNTYAYYYNNDVSFQDNSILFDKSNIEGNKMSWIFLRAYRDNTLVLDGYGSTRTVGTRYSKVLDLNGSYQFNRIGIKINTNKTDGVLYIKNILDQSKKYTISFNVDMLDFDHAKAIISNLQLEDGEVATEYEPFKQYSSDTVVTKSSDHTLHAIWEVAS